MNTRIIAPLVLLATITGLTAWSMTKTDTTATGATQSPVTSTSATTPVVPPVSPESTGATPISEVSKTVTHTQIVSYKSPGGDDKIEYTVAIQNGIISAVSVKNIASNDVSKGYQDGFAKEISAKVVGMPVKKFNLDTVAGASLTTASFNQYIQTL